MTKTLTRAILEDAGGAPEKSANSGNGGKIFVLRFYEPRESKPRGNWSYGTLGFLGSFFAKKLPNDIIQSIGQKKSSSGQSKEGYHCPHGRPLKAL